MVNFWLKKLGQRKQQQTANRTRKVSYIAVRLGCAAGLMLSPRQTADTSAWNAAWRFFYRKIEKAFSAIRTKPEGSDK